MRKSQSDIDRIESRETQRETDMKKDEEAQEEGWIERCKEKTNKNNLIISDSVCLG